MKFFFRFPGRELEVNRRLTNNRPFDWKEYLKQTRTQAAHRACFPKLNTLVWNSILLKLGLFSSFRFRVTD